MSQNYTQNGIPSTTVTTTGGPITTYLPNYTYSDPYIYQDSSPDYMVHRDAMQIVKDEITNMDSINPNELNKLINSNNSEDFELAINMIESQGGNYSGRILRTIRNTYPSVDNLRSILKEWYQKNYLNITNKYI